ncbi:hypothetical protein SPRG_16165 [Saprolegnia parasitica CBS 223.65]|uniref:Glycoside hydrolase family 5 domain-containing protein n=1 Tax=Saprolegnia parasitica (strain CBS 223.65) TaxID=695850 RepID=A0A067BV49_SAPPC|nr:hypothetical protein SPRG_16165 [Saprolegnia parasitica CBS 223.65]KDO18507.1 hypothetical protein SPRG_16165 [Saprolegnia parasitica CBS 223.65]|eukprot:XP_012210784.1 hypothetical protein SPRG_16165 [Saprolegnia parasitica CBS 223.65]
MAMVVVSSPLPSPVPVLAAQEFASPDDEKPSDYHGRRTIWPGSIFCLVLLVGSVVLLTYLGENVHTKTIERVRAKLLAAAERKRIASNGSSMHDAALIDPIDGQVDNPRQYPARRCALPNYVSKNNGIYAEHAGTSQRVSIKGINWFGAETAAAIPMGLWDNGLNGTTVMAITSFLAEHNFNSVRVPLCVEHLLRNTAPDPRLVNVHSNRAFDIGSYVRMLQSLVIALGAKNISVLLDLHTLTTTEKGDNWFSAAVPQDAVLSAVDVLTTHLCAPRYWNVLGLDLKNEPWKATWGTDEPSDFRIGATLLGNRMLAGCPSWLAFVEGTWASHDIPNQFSYFDWWGGGLQKAGSLPVMLSQMNKVVYAPHYYNPSVSVQPYMYASGNVDSNGALQSYVELDDATLRSRIALSMHHMFGYLTSTTPHAVVLGEFGGLYGGDTHPKRTNQRVTQLVVAMLAEPATYGYACGYVWSLNPESGYAFSDGATMGAFHEGLVDDTWLKANDAYLQALSPMDAMPHLSPFPCFELMAVDESV